MHDTIDFQPMITLSNGVDIPAVGLGTFRIESQAEMSHVVEQAYRAGYRHVDTASFYGNEHLIREAVKQASIPRERLFITSKVWITDNGYESTLSSFKRTLKQLETTYLDLYLIHWPSEATLETWMALERLYAEGKVRAIGVSNFTEEDLNVLVESNHIKPMINQIEIHPGYVQDNLVRYCRRHNVAITASAPLGRGTLLDNPEITDIAEQSGKSPAQVILRWHLQRQIIPIPKSSHTDRLETNIDLFDFSLDEKQMMKITQIQGERLFSPPVIS
jgi:diketogulonate reductase-like aldo/keto reductase